MNKKGIPIDLYEFLMFLKKNNMGCPNCGNSLIFILDSKTYKIRCINIDCYENSCKKYIQDLYRENPKIYREYIIKKKLSSGNFRLGNRNISII